MVTCYFTPQSKYNVIRIQECHLLLLLTQHMKQASTCTYPLTFLKIASCRSAFAGRALAAEAGEEELRLLTLLGGTHLRWACEAEPAAADDGGTALEPVALGMAGGLSSLQTHSKQIYGLLPHSRTSAHTKVSFSIMFPSIPLFSL